ncbi:DUF262 domain-containing protein [Spirosoma flavum]|uniref:DUF262 domain-containing protein n=1 Tax=Spirosoma flavum TaxID=2048557 RepID=A0ABW6AUW5_9BACT
MLHIREKANMKDIFEDSEDKLGVDVPKEKRYLNTASYDYSVQFISELMSGQHPKIILEVPFQRNFVWKEDRASQLIESVIMNVPIPPLYFSEEDNGKWLVIDGLQRLNALKNFYENEYPLKGLEILKELEKLKYKDLPPKAKDLLNDGLLRINVIKKDSHPDIKYDIFMRLNKGAVSLNYQELRNCLYRGDFNNEMKNLAKNPDYLKILNLKKPHDRYQDVEFAIRYFAIKENLQINEEGNYEIKSYTGKMVNFLNEYMDSKKKLTLSEVKHYKIEFDDLVKKILVVFSANTAFRDPLQDHSRINRPIAEFILLSFSEVNQEILEANADIIRKLLTDSLQDNEEFRRSISQRTSDREIVNLRINYWMKIFKDALGI